MLCNMRLQRKKIKNQHILDIKKEGTDPDKWNETEIIQIRDQNVIYRKLEHVIDYFRNINDEEEVEILEKTKKKLIRHFNFE